jgi:hypothetical protein
MRNNFSLVVDIEGRVGKCISSIRSQSCSPPRSEQALSADVLLDGGINEVVSHLLICDCVVADGMPSVCMGSVHSNLTMKYF